MKPKDAGFPWAAALIAAAALLAYGNSLQVPFLFDDGPATVGNATIRALRTPWVALFPPPGTTVSGRPFANFTFALNYALSGDAPWSYHALNLAIHVLAGLVLLGIVRRTLQRPLLAPRFGRDAPALALVFALLWVLHPVQTEAVTYVVQRVESLMSLLYLLTLYCFLRSVDVPRPRRWQVVAVATCLLGMATKEVIVTAPVLVLLYDRTFVAGTFRAAWLRRRGFYVALALTWLPLALLVAGTGWNREGSAGFSAAISPSSYWLTQVDALARYLGLAFWPHPLVFDYGPNLVARAGSVVPQLLVAATVVTLTTAALWRCPLPGFLGAWFLGILSPTLLVPVGTQAIAEHRLYLALAAVVGLGVTTAYALGGRRSLAPLGLVALLFGILTFERNVTYQSAVALWSDTVTHRPENARAHCSLGQALAEQPGELPAAVAEFEEALRLHSNYSEAHADLGLALEKVPGRAAEAEQQLGEAVRIRPEMPEWQLHLGVLLCESGQMDEGIAHLQSGVRGQPLIAGSHFLLANALAETGQVPEAITEFETALRIDPAMAEASNNLGVILCRIGRTEEGTARIEGALRINPDFAPAHFALAAVYLQAGRPSDAESQYEEVLRLRPDDAAAHRMLSLIRTLR